MPTTIQTGPTGTDTPRGGRMIYRHAVLVRVTHWINVICMTFLLMSGLQIFNAHPALYWGKKSSFADPILAMVAPQSATGQPIGVTTIFGHAFNTTGVLGFSGSAGDGEGGERGFPAWATLPRSQWLAMGRRLHFLFAWIFILNGAIYAAYTLVSGHLWRGLLPSRQELGHIRRSLSDHLRLRFPKGAAAKRYNVVQKLSYLVVLLVLVPLLILAGLTMSPRMDAGFPALLTFFDGRQSARTIHFLCAFALLGFVLIHVVMVLVSGVWNNLRSMITGRYDIGVDGGENGN
jgi:thiosulfate reductase cytochrome b subunit